MLKVRLIGKFDIQCDDQPIILSSRAAQSLFAYLILTVGTLHRREKLAGMFWPDESEQKARTYLRNELWRIQKTLPHTSNIEYLLADNLTIGFNSFSAYQLDVAELKKLSDRSSADELIQALSNYQGELLPGFYEDWAVLEREHLQVFFEQKIARLLEILEKEQRWNDILEWAERWIRSGKRLKQPIEL
jgi:DNA-binding SARP family transcriptional activator